MSSILTDTKAALGIAADYEAFDTELVMHINSVIADLDQLGIGPTEGPGYEIVDDTNEWSELLEDETRYNAAKSLMYLKVKMLFDPPSVGYVLTAYEKMIEKAEWRLNVAREVIVYPTPPDEDIVVLDGGEL